MKQFLLYVKVMHSKHFRRELSFSLQLFFLLLLSVISLLPLAAGVEETRAFKKIFPHHDELIFGDVLYGSDYCFEQGELLLPEYIERICLTDDSLDESIMTGSAVVYLTPDTAGEIRLEMKNGQCEIPEAGQVWITEKVRLEDYPADADGKIHISTRFGKFRLDDAAVLAGDMPLPSFLGGGGSPDLSCIVQNPWDYQKSDVGFILIMLNEEQSRNIKAKACLLHCKTNQNAAETSALLNRKYGGMYRFFPVDELVKNSLTKPLDRWPLLLFFMLLICLTVSELIFLRLDKEIKIADLLVLYINGMSVNRIVVLDLCKNLLVLVLPSVSALISAPFLAEMYNIREAYYRPIYLCGLIGLLICMVAVGDLLFFAGRKLQAALSRKGWNDE